jgi:hypothetical protein
MKHQVIGTMWLLMCLAVGTWVAWMSMDNEPPYVWDATESYIKPNPATQEGLVTANWKLNKVNRICPASLQRFFYNHETGEIASTLDRTEASRAVRYGDERLPRSFQLPPGLPPIVDYSVLVCFECNAYQRLIAPLCILTPRITFNVRDVFAHK